MHTAINCSDKSIFPLLLRQSGIDLNDINIYGNNCFMLACFRGNMSALEVLWDSSFKTKVKTYRKAKDTNRTASHYACVAGHVPVVEFLLKHGLFQANTVDCLGDTPFGSACCVGQSTSLPKRVEMTTTQPPWRKVSSLSVSQEMWPRVSATEG